jgi:hypothetical protein
VRRTIGTIIVFALLLAACGSGPSPEALDRNQPPSTTTTTEAASAEVVVVRIENGKFSPSLLEIDLTKQWIVRWENDDPPREYTIISRTAGLFESPVIKPGESWEFDFSKVEPGLYRYHTFVGDQRIPGLIDTRPAR